MRMVVTVTAAVIAATGMISPAFAEGAISCDSSLPNDSVRADDCSVWNSVPAAPPAYAAAPMQYGASAYGFAPRRDHRIHNNRTDIHGGAGN